MESIWKQHQRFLKQAYLSSKFDNDPFSALPSAIFLVGAFSLLYFHLRPYYISLNWRRSMYKNVMFHWIFFYIFRMWLVFVKLVKYFNSLLNETMKGSTPDEELMLSRALVNALLFLIVLTISVSPLLLLRLFIIYSRQGGFHLEWNFNISVQKFQSTSIHIHNPVSGKAMFFSQKSYRNSYRHQVHPWDRNEMGRGIRYLETRQVVPESRYSPKPYRSKRSTSFDNNLEFRDQEVALRSCKSLTDICSSHKLN